MSLVRLSHFKSAPGVSNVTSSRHFFCCCRNCARGLPGRRKAGVRGCGDPRTVRRWQMGGRLDGHSSAGPLWRTRLSSGSASFDRNARPLRTVSDYFHHWRIGRTRGDMSPVIVLTIGHSTRSIDEFIRLLAAHGVDRLVDIRTIPRSRHNPQFSRDLLSAALRRAGIRYTHMAGLGGLRHSGPDSVNRGWRNAGFRGYADYLFHMNCPLPGAPVGADPIDRGPQSIGLVEDAVAQREPDTTVTADSGADAALRARRPARRKARPARGGRLCL